MAQLPRWRWWEKERKAEGGGGAEASGEKRIRTPLLVSALRSDSALLRFHDSFEARSPTKPREPPDACPATARVAEQVAEVETPGPDAHARSPGPSAASTRTVRDRAWRHKARNEGVSWKKKNSKNKIIIMRRLIYKDAECMEIIEKR